MRLLASLVWLGTIATKAAAIIRGISMFGLETDYRDFMCTWVHNIDWNLAKVQELGCSHLRIPFCYDYIQEGNWAKLDELMAKVPRYNLNVTLDFHRVHNTHQSVKPDAEISMDVFIETWKTIIRRYQGNNHFEAVDVFNEIEHGDAQEWNQQAHYIVTQLENTFPGRLKYYVGGTNWGGLTRNIDLSDLPFADRIFLTIHKYHFSDKEPLEGNWDSSFGPNKAIINVGEWGFRSDQPNEVAWANRFIDWLISKGVRDSFFWVLTYNSGDTGGILKEDCTTVDEVKMAMLRRYWNAPQHRGLLRRV